MATDVVRAPDQLATLQTLLTLLTGGGEQIITNPGDVRPLHQVIAQMQADDPAALLQSIFQRAGGAIPGLVQTHANAVGARTGNNSAVAAALEQLLKDTTIAAQNQLVQQQTQRRAIQQQAAANIAQATRDTRRTKQPDTITGSPIGDLLGMVAVARAARGLTGDRTVGDMLGRLTGVTTPAHTAPATVNRAVPAAQLQSARVGGGLQMPAFNISQLLFDGAAPTIATGLQAPYIPQNAPLDFSFIPMDGFNPATITQPSNEFVPGVPMDYSLAAPPVEGFNIPVFWPGVDDADWQF